MLLRPGDRRAASTALPDRVPSCELRGPNTEPREASPRVAAGTDTRRRGRLPETGQRKKYNEQQTTNNDQ
ncbi:unnamed protein product [Protopolystoma xenopodis]|uniref:Uncharacterized protein n=1 Tax=Protopolystoma xenopodis TaxID=117903 RepID=A0A3S5CMV3_9PLAT|nr:unnamed protein product [Protopolystoma xenopodis]